MEMEAHLEKRGAIRTAPEPLVEQGGGGPPLRALLRPDLNSLMRGWMMGDRVTRGRGDWHPAVPPEPEPEPVSRLEEKFT